MLGHGLDHVFYKRRSSFVSSYGVNGNLRMQSSVVHYLSRVVVLSVSDLDLNCKFGISYLSMVIAGSWNGFLRFI